MMSPSPGPILAIAVAAPDSAVTKSSPVSPSAMAIRPSVTMKTPKNEVTEFNTSAVTGRPS